MTSSNKFASSVDAKRIGIIGGGFGGAAMAYHLARSSLERIDIVVYEPRARIGYGVAYSVPDDHLLLNVAAGKLSIDPERPADFLDWRLSLGQRADSGAFLPRSWFGAYAEARMAEQIHSTRGRVTLRRVPSRVERIDVNADELRITDLGGGLASVDHAILAVGHGPTRLPEAIAPFRNSPQVLLCPWDRPGMTRIADEAERVLLVGTGLTMCDAAITLMRMGFRGELTAISRRGLVPRVHGPSDPTKLADWIESIPAGSLHTLRREVRTMTRMHGWRTAVDALRGRTTSLWRALSRYDQDRFIRRLAPYWDAHRHRLPVECASEINTLRDTGSLRILRGCIRRVRRTKSGLTCELQSHGSISYDTLHADAIVLCTGPDPDPRRWNSPLIDQLINDGLVNPEANGLGLQTTDSGLLIGRGAVVQHRLSTLGPLRRGSLWESTAVPEIAAQAAHLGRHLTDTRVPSAPPHHRPLQQSAQPAPSQ